MWSVSRPVWKTLLAWLMAGWVLAACGGRASAQPALCKDAVAGAELDRHIPNAFLSAMAGVESGRTMNGLVVPWPWTVNAEGVGSFYATKTDAIAAVQALQARGVRSIDVGCMQVNLQQHPEAFRSLDQAFDPVTNARFAASFLMSLFAQTGSWPLAAAAYHSQTPMLGAAYQKQVLAAWAQPDRAAALPGHPAAQGGGADAAGPHEAGADAAAGAPAPAVFGAFGRQSSIFAAAGQPAPGAPHATGRSLAAYRAVPVRLAFRPLAKRG